jgi:hypothetical protein
LVRDPTRSEFSFNPRLAGSAKSKSSITTAIRTSRGHHVGAVGLEALDELVGTAEGRQVPSVDLVGHDPEALLLGQPSSVVAGQVRRHHLMAERL